MKLAKTISASLALTACVLGTTAVAQAQVTNGLTTYYNYTFGPGYLQDGSFQLGNGVNIPDNWCALSGYGTYLIIPVGGTIVGYTDSLSLGHGGANNTYNITATNVLPYDESDAQIQVSCTSYSNFTTAQSSNWYSNTTASDNGPFPGNSYTFEHPQRPRSQRSGR
jgi:hypothetical protein